MTRSIWLAGAAAVLLSAVPAAAGPAEDRAVAQVIDEGMNRSEAMLTASELMDRIGPRLTNSDGYQKAEDWALAKFAAYGLKNVHAEPFEFGLGWDLKSHSARMVSPRPLEMTAIPVAWSPGTNGPIRAEVVIAPMSEDAHFDAWRGKLAGKIVLVSLPGAPTERTDPTFKRLSDSEIADLDKFDQPSFDPDSAELQLND